MSKHTHTARAPTTLMLALAATLGLGAATGHAGENYRWVDEDGQVHYGDTMPASQVDQKHSVIDESGVVRETRDPAAREEDGAKEADQGGESDDASQKADVDKSSGPEPRSDELLLRVYTNEEALLRARDRKIEAVELRIDLARQSVKRLRTRYAEYKKQVLDLPEDGDAYPAARKRLETIEQRLREREAHLADLRADKRELEAQFAADLARYRELKSQQASN